MLVLRQNGDKAGCGPGRLLLDPVDRHDPEVSFAWAQSTGHASGEAFEVVQFTRGCCQGPPRFAVFDEWQVAADGDREGFVQSRMEFFDLQAGATDSFCAGYLLCHAGDPRRLATLSLYGDRAGLNLVRRAPDMVAWAEDHPASLWGASELSGTKQFRVAAASGWPEADRAMARRLAPPALISLQER